MKISKVRCSISIQFQGSYLSYFRDTDGFDIELVYNTYFKMTKKGASICIPMGTVLSFEIIEDKPAKKEKVIDDKSRRSKPTTKKPTNRVSKKTKKD
jgi:hypothetical protein